MKFTIYLKSYTLAPDFEETIEADSKEVAVQLFYEKLAKYGWEKNLIRESVVSEDEMNLFAK